MSCRKWWNKMDLFKDVPEENKKMLKNIFLYSGSAGLFASLTGLLFIDHVVAFLGDKQMAYIVLGAFGWVSFVEIIMAKFMMGGRKTL